MKTKTLSVLGTAFVLAAGTLYTAGVPDTAAANINANVNANVSASTNYVGVNASSTVKASTTRGNATSSAAMNKNNASSTATSTATSTRGNATSSAAVNKRASTTDANAQGQITAESHRSVVSTFVHSLLNVAGREGGIGAQVSVVANSQNDSGSTTVAALAKVEGRGALRTFLFGSDYKNLGVLKSEIATTTQNIARLQTLLNQTTDVAVRAELTAQIQALQAEQAKIEAYIKARESKFSLFGWFTRLF